MLEVNIEVATGTVNVEESAFFFFGVPKWGKTELSAGWPHTMHLVSTRKEVKKLRVPYILCDSWDKYKNAVEYLCSKEFRKSEAGKRVKTIVTDVVDTMYEHCEEYCAKALGVKNIRDAGYGRGESRTDQEFRRIFRKLIASKYGVIFISHWDTREVETMHGTIKKNVSILPTRAKKIILRDVSIVGFCTFERKTIVDKVTGAKKKINKRVIVFEPGPEFETGDNDGFLPPKLYINHGRKEYHKTYQQICAYYRGEKGEGA